jgi:HEAT repeat protein
VEGKYASMEARYRLERLNRAIHGKDITEEIVRALEDESSVVRSHAITLAVRYLEPEVLGAMVENDENAVLRNAALEVLERQGPYALPFLREMAGGSNPEASMFAVHVLTGVPDRESIPVLSDLLEHGDENVRLSAIEALGTHGAEEAVPRLCALMEGSLWQQLAVIKALGLIGDIRAVPLILESLSNEMLVEEAADALGGIASGECIPPLWDLLLHTEQPPVRNRVLLALARALHERRAGHGALEERERDGELEAYLLGAVDAPEGDLAKAAATVAVTARFETLYPRIAARAVDAGDRGWIGRLFGRFPEELRKNLAALLEHPEPDVRRGTLEIAPVGGAPVAVLLRRITDEDPGVRMAACRSLGGSRSPEALPALLDRIREAGGEERDAAVEGLARMPESELVRIAPFLDESLPPEQVLDALAVVEGSSCGGLASEVAALLSSANREIRLQALRTAGALPESELEHDVLPILDDPDPSVRIEAIDVLVRRGSEAAVPRLISLLESDDRVRYHAIRALGRLQAAEAAIPLRDLFDGACAHEQVEIVSALMRISPVWIGMFLRERFRGENVEVRRLAAEGLVRIPDALDTTDLLEMAEDEDWSVRSFAAWGLGRSGSPRRREALLDLSRDMEPLVARIAREALDKIREE